MLRLALETTERSLSLSLLQNQEGEGEEGRVEAMYYEFEREVGFVSFVWLVCSDLGPSVCLNDSYATIHTPFLTLSHPSIHSLHQILSLTHSLTSIHTPSIII